MIGFVLVDTGAGPRASVIEVEINARGSSQMLVGFLGGPAEEPSQAGPECQGVGAADVFALDQLAQICAAAK